MMKFAVGYQAFVAGELFCEMVADYSDRIGEVYFSYPGTASGRPDPGGDPELIEQLEYELGDIRSRGIALDLLLNANCYGDKAVSLEFERDIVELLESLENRKLLPEVVTAASPFAAAVVKKHFPGIERRASVNMRIDSTLALDFLIDKFDSFYIRRDLQRDLPTLQLFHEWSRANGKKMGMLVNSGCLRNCPYQSFHDNLVAHDSGVGRRENVSDFLPHLCWDRYCNTDNLSDFLRGSWIRPEDTGIYAPYVDFMKLATRQHVSPRMVIAAYTSGSFDGNILNLTEPCFSVVAQPGIIDNKRLSCEDLPGACATNCRHCGKCEEVLKRSFVKLAEF